MQSQPLSSRYRVLVTTWYRSKANRELRLGRWP